MKKITSFAGMMILFAIFALVSPNVNAQDCSGFTVLPDAICNPENTEFNVLLVFDGAPGVTVTDNSTGGSISTGASTVTFGPVLSGTGYSFTVVPTFGGGAGADCPPIVISESNVDCNVTAVELLRFSGSAEAQGNLINWTTATETDVKSFVVEHSVDGVNFAQVGVLDAAVNSNTAIDYSYLHNTTTSGVHYYRLLEVTVTGETNVVSSVLSIDRATNTIEIAEISPIPANDYINVEFTAAEGQEIVIEVVDVTGRVLSTQNAVSSPEGNVTTIDVSTLTVGTYFVTISNDDQKIIGKFVKN